MPIRKHRIPTGKPNRFMGDSMGEALAQVPDDFRPYAAGLYKAMQQTKGMGVALMVANADGTVSFSSFIHPDNFDDPTERQALMDFLGDVAQGLRSMVLAMLKEDGEEDNAAH